MAEFVVRPAQAGDARAMAELMAAVAQERDGIATEPPVDVEERTAGFARSAAESVVAVAGGRIVGTLHVSVSRHGFGELGMLVERDWRGRGGRCCAAAGGDRLGTRTRAAQTVP
jgi:L-amino acid N-acyltransferase YncA